MAQKASERVGGVSVRDAASLLASRSPGQLTMRTIAGRLAGSGDPWQGMARHRRGLASARRRLDALRAG